MPAARPQLVGCRPEPHVLAADQPLPATAGSHEVSCVVVQVPEGEGHDRNPDQPRRPADHRLAWDIKEVAEYGGGCFACSGLLLGRWALRPGGEGGGTAQ